MRMLDSFGIFTRSVHTRQCGATALDQEGQRQMVKEVNFFLPVDELGPEESERHYLAVHVPQSRYMYRQLPSVQRYTPHRVLAKRDLNTTFLERPDRWRFVIMHHSGEQNY